MKNTEFISDFSVPGMLYAVTIRSPIACGVLKGIECPALPESYQLITAEQIPGENQLANFSVPVLANEKLSYIGQPVAILAGPEAARLEELSSQIKLTTEEGIAVFEKTDGVYGEEDVIVKRSVTVGDNMKPQTEDVKSIVSRYTTGIQEHWYSEAHGSLAIPAKKPAEAFTVYTATQWPFHVKRSVARVLGLDGARVTVVPTNMMLHLDGKLWYPSLVSCHAALAALVTGSPVKLMLLREEDFMFSPKRNGSKIIISSDLGEQGEIRKTEVQLTLDFGAEGVFGDEIIDQTCLGALGLYTREAFTIEGAGIRTNIPPQGPMAGFGLSQGFFAAERHVSRIADSLGQDPAEWRKNNLLPKSQGKAGAGSLAIGIKLNKSAPLAELIDAAASMSDYHRKWAAYELLRGKRREEKWAYERRPLRGIGLSIACQGNGFLHGAQYGIDTCEVELTLEKDGILEIKTSLGLSEAGFLEGWQNLARDILGVEPSMVRLTRDTTNVPDSGPGTLSRNIGSITMLVEHCCTAIRSQRFRDPLPITVKRSAKPKKTPGWVAKNNIDPEAFSNPGWGASVVEIEMDPVSLAPVIRGIWLVVDGGRIMNKRMASRALRTGSIQALGWASREQILYEDGKIPVEYYRSYGIPAPEEIPPIHLDFLQSESTDPKGVGELPFSCIPAAYCQAVSQAMDHHFERIPLCAREIWKAWKSKKTEIPQ